MSINYLTYVLTFLFKLLCISVLEILLDSLLNLLIISKTLLVLIHFQQSVP